MYPPEDGQDVIGNGDQRGRLARWPERADRRMMCVLAVAALAVGLIAGYLGGHQQTRAAEPPRPQRTIPPPSQRPPSQSAALALGATGNRCAVQRGTTVGLGIEVVNQSDHAIAMRQFLVSYTNLGQPATAELDEFSDLGQVAYSQCRSTQ